MHALILNGAVEKYPYSIGNLRKDNPQVSFPKNPSDATLAEYGVLPVARTDRPEHDPITQDVTEQPPELVNGVWTQVWVVTPADPEEVEQRRAEQRANIQAERANAYRDEADPIFFKAQRNEAEMAEWEAKVQEIRDRFPYPETEA
jgi:hypothetical protein